MMEKARIVRYETILDGMRFHFERDGGAPWEPLPFWRVLLIVEAIRGRDSRDVRISLEGSRNVIRDDTCFSERVEIYSATYSLYRASYAGRRLPDNVTVDWAYNQFCLMESDAEDGSFAAWSLFRALEMRRCAADPKGGWIVEHLKSLGKALLESELARNKVMDRMASASDSGDHETVDRLLCELAILERSTPAVVSLSSRNQDMLVRAALAGPTSGMVFVAANGRLTRENFLRLQKACLSYDWAAPAVEFAKVPGADVQAVEAVLYDRPRHVHIDDDLVLELVRNVPGADIRRAEAHAWNPERGSARLAMELAQLPGADVLGAVKFLARTQNPHLLAKLVKLGKVKAKVVEREMYALEDYDSLVQFVKEAPGADVKRLERKIFSTENRDLMGKFAKAFPHRPLIPGLLVAEEVTAL